MGKAVEDREDPAGKGAGGERRREIECDGKPEDDDRKGDTDLGARKLSAGHRPEPGQRHGRNEGDRVGDARPATDEPGPEADRDHRQRMIQPGERMLQPVNETIYGAHSGMGKGGCRHHRHERRQGARQPRQHVRLLYPGAIAFRPPTVSMKSTTASTPSPSRVLVKTKGRLPRMVLESRSITARSAPTCGARSVL